MDLSIGHYRTASTRDGLLTMSKRAWCSLKFRQSIRSSSRAAICSFCQRLIIRADLLSPTRVDGRGQVTFRSRLADASHQEASTVEINTRFLFTIALEIQQKDE
jgi:hypothetical protein